MVMDTNQMQISCSDIFLNLFFILQRNISHAIFFWGFVWILSLKVSFYIFHFAKEQAIC